MIASNQQPNVQLAMVRVSKIRSDLPDAIVRLSNITGKTAIDLECFESREVPLNRIAVYFHPRQDGRVVVRHHPDDFEAVNTILRQCGMLLTNAGLVDRGGA